jgi:hypothetical protein
VAFEGPKHCVASFQDFYCSTILERPAGFEPAFTSFVAKAINPLWHGRSKTMVGELRIELRPRAPKARMQGITPFPDWCQPSELNAALSVFSGAYRPRIRGWQDVVDLVGSAPTTSALQVRRSA